MLIDSIGYLNSYLDPSTPAPEVCVPLPVNETEMVAVLREHRTETDRTLLAIKSRIQLTDSGHVVQSRAIVRAYRYRTIADQPD
jgi:hypothetical protein